MAVSISMGEYGIVSRRELLANGHRDSDIRTAVECERLTRLRPGWYAQPMADPDISRAVAAGGALSCLSALARDKVWIPESTTGLHVRLGDHARRTTHHGVRSCGRNITGPIPMLDDTATSVVAAAACVSGDDLTAVFDSVLNRGLLQPGELAGLLRGQPRSVQRALVGVDGSAESGTETFVRLHLRRRRLPYRTQVFIAGVGTVDLLVGKSLVIECDSREHHSGDRIDEDRDRDLGLIRLGFVPMRATYWQVFHDFTVVAAAIEKLISHRDHLRVTGYVP